MLEYLDQVESKRADLLGEYADPNLRRSSVIAQLHQDIGASMKLATIHSHMAIKAVLEDIRTAIEARR